MVAQERPPLTDSPWFWLLTFAGMALVALLAIGPKYGGRQARLERQYQARERIVAERSGNSAAQTERMDQDGDRRDFSTAGDTLVPLWPLSAILSLVVILAAIMLFRGRSRTGSPRDEVAS